MKAIPRASRGARERARRAVAITDDMVKENKYGVKDKIIWKLRGGCAVSCERFGKCPPADILVRGDFSTVWSRTKACFSSF